MTQPYPHLRRNFLAFGFDYVFFALGFGFINYNTVVPAFAVQLGASEAMVGALITALLLAWTLPQLVAGNLVTRAPSKRAVVIRMALLGRPAILGLALVILLTQARPAWLSLAALSLAYAAFFGTDAFCTVAWLDLLGRAIAPEKRGSSIGIWQVVKAVGLSGVAATVGYVLSDQGPPFPLNFALLFGAASLLLGLSILAQLNIYEPAAPHHESEASHIRWRDFGPYLARIWRGDSRFRRISIARVLFALSTMSFPFYVLYATEELHFPTRAIGLFIFGQTVGTSVASLFLGRVADRHGAQRVIQIGGAIALTAPLLALAIALSGQSVISLLSRAYIWIYICIGLADNLMMLGYLNYVYDVSPTEQRSIYMGLFNTVASIGMLGPIVAGWVVSWASYAALFAVSFVLGAGALALAFRLPLARNLTEP